jgi:hypothetical protein
MAVSVNWITGVITIPRADMPIIQASPEVRELDTATFFDDLKDLEASVEGMPWPDTQRHNLPYTISGITYAESLEIIPPYSVTFEDGTYAVSLKGTNNNLIDVANTNQVRILANNSAGLIDVPVTQADKDAIVAQVFAQIMEGTETFAQQIKLIRAEAAGSIVRTGTLHQIKSADGGKDRITATADDTGRTVTDTDGT